MRTMRALIGVVFMFALIGGLRPAVMNAADDVPRITKEAAKALLGKPKVVFLDARTGSGWSGSDRKITGAVRVDPSDVKSWAAGYARDTQLIVYCS